MLTFGLAPKKIIHAALYTLSLLNLLLFFKIGKTYVDLMCFILFLNDGLCRIRTNINYIKKSN